MFDSQIKILRFKREALRELEQSVYEVSRRRVSSARAGPGRGPSLIIPASSSSRPWQRCYNALSP